MGFTYATYATYAQPESKWGKFEPLLSGLSLNNKPILARFDDSWQIGFLVERIPEGHVTVFIPDALSPWSGGIYIMDQDRVKSLEVPSMAVLKSFQKLGEGTAGLVKGKL